MSGIWKTLTVPAVILAVLVSLVSCMNVVVTEPAVCKTVPLDIPTEHLPRNKRFLGTFSIKQDVDMSKAVKRLDGSAVKDASINIESIRLLSSQDLSWVHWLSVTSQDKSFATYSNENANETKALVLQPQMTGNQVRKFFKKPVTLLFTVSGILPSQVAPINAEICLGASANIKKSL